MILVFDIGNSSICFGVADLSGERTELKMRSKIATAPPRSADEYVLLIRDILYLHSVDATQIKAAAISSVVPELTAVIAAAAAAFTGSRPLIIGPGVRTGLSIHVDSQTQLGTDIVSNAVASLNHAVPPVVIVDLGTATTLTAVDAFSTMIGAIICPGIRVSMQALSASASMIGGSDFLRPPALIGKNTHDSVNSGVINGHVLMIDGFVRELRQLLAVDEETKLSLIATGGLAEFVVPYCRNKFKVIPDLTLLGVAEIFRRNKR